MSYQELDILTDKVGRVRWRVFIKGATTTWLFDVTNIDRALPFPRLTAELERAEQNMELTVLVCAGAKRRTPGMASYAAGAHGRLSLILQDREALVTEVGRGIAFAKLKETDATLTYKTFIKLLRRYFAAGGVPDAMRTGWDRCGPDPIDTTNLAADSLAEAIRQCQAQALQIDLTKAKLPTGDELTSTKAGKQRKRLPPMHKTLYRVDRSTLRVFLKYWETIKPGSGRDLGKAYRDMCIEVFSSTDALGTVVPWSLQRVPSLRQFSAWYPKLNDFKKRRTSRVTDKEYATGEREVLGSEYSVAVNAGAVGSGDATIWNVGLRSRFATREVIGPAVVFRIRDKRTGMLLGLSVGLEAPSYNGFATAIASCFEDKVAFCARHNIDIAHADWPIKGLPAGIEADCGETDNRKPNRFINATGVGFKNITGGRPDIKGGTESDFRTLQVSMNGEATGALIERWQAAVKQEWRIKATLDIDEFTTFLIRHELLKMKALRNDVLLPAEMLADGVDTSSLSMWNWHVAKRAGGLRAVDPVAATLSLMEEDTASIGEDGISFRGIFYVADKLLASHAFAAARRHGSQPVNVVFDPRLVDNIYIVSEGMEPILCRLNMRLEWQHDYVGKSFAEVKGLAATRAAIAGARADETHKAAMETRLQNKQLIEESKKKTAEASGPKLPVKTQMRGLKDARTKEKFAHSPSQALRPLSSPVEPPAAQAANVVSMAKPSPVRPGLGSIFASIVNDMPSTADTADIQRKQPSSD